MNTSSLTVSKTILSLEEQVELGRRMVLFGDQDARDELVLNCVPVVKDIAGRFAKHKLASYDDLFQEGMAGVMEAIDRYDYTKNVRFITFAYTRIIHRITRWINKQIRFGMVGRSVHNTNGLILDTTIETFQEMFSSMPTDAQLAGLLSAPAEDVVFLRKQYSNPVPPAFRAPVSYDSNSHSPAAFTDVASMVEKTMCDEYNRKHILAALDMLNELDRDIISKRYLYSEKKATLEELAGVHHLNVSTISRRERNALAVILRYFKDNNIQPEL